MRNFTITEDQYTKVKTYRNAEGRSHRDGDLPACVVKQKNTMGISFWVNGKLHRENKPAVIVRQNGRVITRAFYNNGERLRSESFDREGNLTKFW